MITNTERSKHETRIRGTVNLTPIEYANMPDSVIAATGLPFGSDIPIEYCACIDWTLRIVTVTIGDYIIAEWHLGTGASVIFNNRKGYGNDNLLDHIDSLPVGIVSDVISVFWPKL